MSGIRAFFYSFALVAGIAVSGVGLWLMGDSSGDTPRALMATGTALLAGAVIYRLAMDDPEANPGWATEGGTRYSYPEDATVA